MVGPLLMQLAVRRSQGRVGQAGRARSGESSAGLALATSTFPAACRSRAQQANVNINGAEALAQLEPGMRQMMTQLLNQQLTTVFKQHFPEAGVNLG